jgi:hypothetical protein
MNTFKNTCNPINRYLNKVGGANDEPIFKKSIISNNHLLLCKNNLTCLKGNMGWNKRNWSYTMHFVNHRSLNEKNSKNTYLIEAVGHLCQILGINSKVLIVKDITLWITHY